MKKRRPMKRSKPRKGPRPGKLITVWFSGFRPFDDKTPIEWELRYIRI